MTSRSATPRRWPHLVIRASAGSGKTFRLSNRYLELIQAAEPVDSILATTFTRAAAAEIQDRVLLRLAQAATDEHECRQLAGFLHQPSLRCEDCRQWLAELARQIHRLRIGTLDSFFIQVAQSFSWELGLPANWRILSELADARLRESAVAAVLSSDDQETLTRLVQWLTKGEAQRSLGELLDSTVAQLYELYREAPREAWTRVPRPSGLSPAELTACLAALEKVLLPDHKNIAKARQNDLESARSGNWEQFAQRGLAAVVAQGRDTYYKKQLDEQVIAVYSQLLRHAVSVFLGKLSAQTEATRDLLERFDVQYDRIKHRARGLLFSDVTHLVGTWFGASAHPAASASPSAGSASRGSHETLAQLAFRLDARLNHLLLDEFQDTSLPQWNVLRPLAQRITNGGPGHSFFCVGDGKQAIYGWRGGVAEIFDALEEQLDGLVRDPLNESRRSAPVIIDTVNRVFRDMVRHTNLERCESAVREWAAAFPEHTTARRELSGYVTLETGPAPDDTSDDDNPLLSFTAERIQELAAAAPNATIGVLVRSNSTIAELIFRLRRLGVAASEEGGNPLGDSAAVQLILSALEFADHPAHTVAQFHLETSPLGPALGIPPVERRRGAPRPSAAHSSAARQAAALRAELLDRGYGPTIERWSRVLADECDQRDWRRLQQLVSRAYQHDHEATLRPRDFVAAVRRERAADPTQARVRVTTIHKSKGLQYDIVVLPELTSSLLGQPDGYAAGRESRIGPVNLICRYVNQDLRSLLPPRFQDLFAEQDRQATCEALCVLYVALTRAVHALHLILPPSTSKETQGLPRTFAGLLRAALTEGQPLEPLNVAFEAGDPAWSAGSPPPPTPPPPPTTAVPSLPLRLATGPRQRGLERVAPSSLEGGRRVRLPAALDEATHQGRQRGTVLHAWFEQIGWLADGLPKDETLRAQAVRVLDTPLSAEQFSAWRQAFLAALAQPQVRDLLDPAYYRHPDSRFPAAAPQQRAPEPAALTVAREWRFAVRLDERLVSGTIDRLVLLRPHEQVLAADIVDYKTDALEADDPAALQARIDFYRPQLQAYRAAVARTFHLDAARVTTRLVFLSLGQVVLVTP
ncbi:MAG: UvrD-helicase domain-containing protein [Pirellulales bacterium]